jgi:phage gp45-like
MKPEFIQLMTRKISSGIKVAMPATIEEYDFATQKASVKIDMQEAIGEDGVIDYPVLTNVPIIFPRSGGASLTMPVKRGDHCLLLFLDRDITAWLLGAKSKKPPSQRRHNLNDAVALMGLSPFSAKSMAKNNTDLLLTYHGSSISLKPNGQIDIDCAKILNIKSQDININCAKATIKASDDITIEAAKALNIKAKNIVINCTKATIKASDDINTETPNFTQKGKMIIDGDIEVKGKSLLKGNTNIEANIEVKGSSALKGNATCDGTITGASVKTSSGIALAGHKHSYQEAQSGSNPTIVTPSITGGAS